MKKIIVILSVFLMSSSLCAQPAAFSWSNRHSNHYNYISTAKDQEEQGPCRIFASVAAVEAMAQIYFNKNWAALNLSESNIYNGGYGCPGFGCSIASASVEESLGLIESSGIVDENCFPYPTEPGLSGYCRTDCENICGNPANLVSIPKYSDITESIDNNQDLKEAIMDYGPIIAVIAGTKNGYNVGCELHPGGDCNYSHTVLIVGWKSSPGFKWHIKDSWPNDAKIFYSSVNIFSYENPDPIFYRIYPVYDDETISCSGSDCSIFNNRSYEDHDGDGFYNWGLDLSSKPAGCSGPDKMDFDDDDADHIFLSGYSPLPTPTISSPSEPVCDNGGTFTLNNKPSGFSVQWNVTPSYYFNSPVSGNTTSATVYPKSQYIGKECTITFTISHNGTASYSENFIINGPDEDQVSITVEDAYGGSPPKYGDIYLLCPYSTYYIYYNNYTSCSTWDFDWELPDGWTEYWASNNYVSIGTNNSPYGILYVWAKTCCEDENRVNVKYQYFASGGGCGGYFSFYPNPASGELMISFDDKLDMNVQNKSLEIYDNDFNLMFKLDNFVKEITVNTNGWKDGYYFIRFNYNGKLYTERVQISH